MRKLFVIVGCFLATLSAVAEEKGEAVKFKSFTAPYFEKNNSGLKGNSTYMVIPNARTFGSFFGIARTMGKPPETLPDNAFENSLVVAVIKRGEGVTKYTVESVEAKDGNLTVSYKAVMDPPGTATFHSPIIFAIDKGKYKSVTFLENGKKVEKVDLDK